MSVSTPAVPASSSGEVVQEVSGAAYTPLETGSTVLLGILALLISGLLTLTQWK